MGVVEATVNLPSSARLVGSRTTRAVLGSAALVPGTGVNQISRTFLIFEEGPLVMRLCAKLMSND